MKQSVRLPSHITPNKYSLTLKPDLEASVFSGEEVVSISIDKKIKKIVIHSKDIEIESVLINYKNNNKLLKEFAYKITYNIKLDTVTFYFKNFIPKGKAKLVIIFAGIINDTLRGFYKSKYILNNETKYLATTQFESTDARRAFPCFDEPAHKAIFEVKLIIKDDHTAISNTLPTSIKEHGAGYKVVSFSPTPIMSTYLLAFIIGEFEYLEGKTKSGVLVRVFTTIGKKHQAKFALSVAMRSLEFYNDYFNIPYPLPTLDLIAIPDFESAAMENWGAVTFRETALLVDEKHTSLSNKQWVAIVIAHELAHQWFGNLVTMHWWTDLWLNEGFASYMENFCINKLFPKWKIWDLYLSNRYTVALKLDALSNSHPIEIKVNHPSEISEIFDMVSYAKGSAIIRMIAEYIGENDFRDGLRHYLKKHSYKNTKTVDLWNAFEKVSKKPVKKIMRNWTSLTGYPLISVISLPKSNISISQERFFSSRISSKKNNTNSLWQIPLSYENLSQKKIINEKILLKKKKSSLLDVSSVGKVNINDNTFTRVHYDSLTLSYLKGEIEKGNLTTKNKLGIVRDLFALAEGGYIDTVEALSFSLSYKNETEFIIWREISIGVNKIFNLIKDEPFANLYKSYALSLFSPLAKKLGWNSKKNEEDSQVFLRSLALRQAIYYGDKKIINSAKENFKNKKSNLLRADMRNVIYNAIALDGNIKDWNYFNNLYLKEEFHEEKERLGLALASFKDKDLLLKTLEFALSGKVRTQDKTHLITLTWMNVYGKDLTWKFIKKNWKKMIKEYGVGGQSFPRLLSPLGNHIKLKDLKDTKKFFKNKNILGIKRTLEQIYEKIESNAMWIKEDKQSIKKWLNNNYK